jgi:hypothetical protein
MFSTAPLPAAAWHVTAPKECLRFLNGVEAAVSAGKLINAILDNYAIHKHLKVRAWLARHSRWTLHFTPTSCSRLNAAETLLLRPYPATAQGDSFSLLVDLQETINRYLEVANANPKLFLWIAEPDRVIEKVRGVSSALVGPLAGQGSGRSLV